MAKSKHKYAAVCANLPKLGLDPERKAVIEQTCEEIKAPRFATEPALLPDQRLDLLVGVKRRVELLLTDLKRSTAGTNYASAYAQAYKEARELESYLDQLRSNATLLREAFEFLMGEQMEAEGLDALTLADGGGSIYVREEPYCKVVDKEAFRAWCVEQGLERQMHLQWNVANALNNNRLLEGDPEPPGIETKARRIITLRGA